MMSDNERIVPVLAALIPDSSGAYLLARRKPGLANGGTWEFPGGKLRSDETPEACLAREIREELGITLSVQKPVHLVRHRYPHIHILLIGYACEWLSGTFKLLDHDRIEWVRPENMAKFELSTADVALAHYLQHRKPPF